MSADKQIKEILDTYGEDFASNTWVVPGGKARAILHKCIERMVAKAGVRFLPPQIVDADPTNVVLVVTGRMGELEDWSFGEASPKNNKNAYPYSMAEKRGKDRVALKLIGLHGLVYSEEEADDFKDRPKQQDATDAVAEAPAKPRAPPPTPTVESLVLAIKNARSETSLQAVIMSAANIKVYEASPPEDQKWVSDEIDKKRQEWMQTMTAPPLDRSPSRPIAPARTKTAELLNDDIPF